MGVALEFLSLFSSTCCILIVHSTEHLNAFTKDTEDIQSNICIPVLQGLILGSNVFFPIVKTIVIGHTDEILFFFLAFVNLCFHVCCVLLFIVRSWV